MIVQQYLGRIPVREMHLPDLSGMLPAVEGFLKRLGIVLVALAVIVGCAQSASALLSHERPTVKVVVKQGDTLWKLASTYGNQERYILSRMQEIASLNGIETSRPLEPGSVIVVPR